MKNYILINRERFYEFINGWGGYAACALLRIALSEAYYSPRVFHFQGETGRDRVIRRIAFELSGNVHRKRMKQTVETLVVIGYISIEEIPGGFTVGINRAKIRNIIRDGSRDRVSTEFHTHKKGKNYKIGHP